MSPAHEGAGVEGHGGAARWGPTLGLMLSGMVSINPGKVRHDWTQMSADRVIHRENDGKMSSFGPKPQRLISVRSEVQIFPGPLK